MKKITPFLWYTNEANDVMEYYKNIFQDLKKLDDGRIEILGQEIMIFNGGEYSDFKFNSSFSFFINCEDQKEVDFYWDKFLENGAIEIDCGWIKDKYGVTWQVIPKEFNTLMSSEDKESVQRMMQEMFKMKKLDIEKLKEVFNNK